MNLEDNDFVLLGLREQFALDRSELDAHWRALQAQVHPDRFVALGAAAQRVSMQWAVRVNEAYQRLKDPVRRAAYLCELHGQPVRPTGQALPMEALEQQMQWREALEQAQGLPEVERLLGTAQTFRARAMEALGDMLDARQDWAAARTQVQLLMFVERFLQELDARLEVLER